MSHFSALSICEQFCEAIAPHVARALRRMERAELIEFTSTLEAVNAAEYVSEWIFDASNEGGALRLHTVTAPAHLFGIAAADAVGIDAPELSHLFTEAVDAYTLNIFNA